MSLALSDRAAEWLAAHGSTGARVAAEASLTLSEVRSRRKPQCFTGAVGHTEAPPSLADTALLCLPATACSAGPLRRPPSTPCCWRML